LVGAIGRNAGAARAALSRRRLVRTSGRVGRLAVPVFRGARGLIRALLGRRGLGRALLGLAVLPGGAFALRSLLVVAPRLRLLRASLRVGRLPGGRRPAALGGPAALRFPGLIFRVLPPVVPRGTRSGLAVCPEVRGGALGAVRPGRRFRLAELGAMDEGRVLIRLRLALLRDGGAPRSNAQARQASGDPGCSHISLLRACGSRFRDAG